MIINKHTYIKKPYIPPIIQMEEIEEDGALMQTNSIRTNVDPTGSETPIEPNPLFPFGPGLLGFPSTLPAKESSGYFDLDEIDEY